jgi:uncharacterized protein (DUF1499 family)
MFKRLLRVLVILLIVLPVAGTLGLQAWARGAKRPTNLGVTNGRLSPCPDSPNCVSTQATSASQQMPALTYTGSLAAAKTRLLAVVQAMPGVEPFADQENYLAFVFRSRLIGYPDDVEFYFDDAAKLIHFRSASRLGKGDLGVNRARMESISKAYAASS